MSIILSVHHGIHDSSAALWDDYRVIAAVQRERLVRQKKAGGPPHECIDEVLAIGGLTRADVEVVAFTRAEFPRAFYKTDFLRRLRDRLRGVGDLTRDLTTVMAKAGAARPEDVIDLPAVLRFYGLPAATRVAFVNHHYCHALPSLFFTDWEDALLYTADGAGDNVNYSHRVFRNGAIETLFGDDRWLHQPYRIDYIVADNGVYGVRGRENRPDS